MKIQEIADRLVELCNRGEFEKALEELYSKDAESIELYDTPGFPKVTKGLDNLFDKSRRFNEIVQEFHSCEVGKPVIAGNSFSVVLSLDATYKDPKMGRNKMDEICVYVVKDGKIVSENFFM
ncbi:hypothetical protein COR50_13025 [Chitinophaga caeni]|uniref:SnoaL-like domain-containing protein n=1 Tax=Chitinophaga caeni TaxID=2029983 RepID=A0A291QVY5_9BACT|nr:nuclear transport factor 2 family protein [Chitinophaga caeni]ATL48013.1 hypothetical protein COR50_13025 [Chitinophaga caeni]